MHIKLSWEKVSDDFFCNGGLVQKETRIQTKPTPGAGLRYLDAQWDLSKSRIKVAQNAEVCLPNLTESRLVNTLEKSWLNS